LRLVRYADAPDLQEIRYEVLSRVTFPEYLQNNVPGNKYWGRLYDDFPDFQLALVDGVAAFVWAPGGQIRGVVQFTLRDDRIVSIAVTGDSERIAALDIVTL